MTQDNDVIGSIKPSDQLTQKQVDNLFACFREQSRLASLSNPQLVAEVLKTDHADSLLVVEMMNRLDPFWSKRP